MVFRVHDFQLENKVIEQLSMESLGEMLPMAAIRAVLAETGKKEIRNRKLPMEMVAALLILMNIYSRESIPEVLEKLFHLVRMLGTEGSISNGSASEDFEDVNKGMSQGSQEGPFERCPSGGAVVYRRKQMGREVMKQLCQKVCVPLATPQTQGAFLFGMRLMAIDGHLEIVPDTPANREYFGKHRTGRGESVYPQVRVTYLCEVGTRAMVDLEVAPSTVGEQTIGRKLARSVPIGSLVMMDRLLAEYALLRAIIKERHAHILARLKSNTKVEVIKRLPDGSYLGWLYPSGDQRKRLVEEGKIVKGSPIIDERLLVRVIEYVVDNPNSPEAGEIHRLITTLLRDDLYPSHTLVCAYHERWEIETAIGEMSCVQHLSQTPLRSKSPDGVYQELCGLMLAHFLVRKVIHQAALQEEIDPDRISFIKTLHILSNSLPLLPLGALLPVEMNDWVQAFQERLIKLVGQCTIPPRRARTSPRKVKQRNRTKFPARAPGEPASRRLDIALHKALVLI